MENRNRNEKIDTLRGCTIILVMVGHAISFLMPKNIILPFGGGIYDAIYTFHMPLFFIISGYIYKSNNEKISSIVLKNVITFYVPYLFMNYLYAAEQMIADKAFGIQLSQNRLLDGVRLMWAGIGMSWFLLSLMLVKIVYNILDTYVSDTFAFIVFSIFFWLSHSFPQYQILDYLQWGVFFCLGHIMNKCQIEKRPKSLIYIGCINLLLLGVERYILCGVDRFVKIFIGVSVFIMFMCKKKVPNIRLLALCGQNSMVIYIVHWLSQYFSYYILSEILHIKIHFILLIFMIVLQLIFSFTIIGLFTRVKCLHWVQVIFYPYQYMVEKIVR